MADLNYTQFDLIKNTLNLFKSEYYKVCGDWARIGYYGEFGTIEIEDLLKSVEETLEAYRKSNISEYSRELFKLIGMLDRGLKSEIIRNLTDFVRDRQEVYYHAQLRSFWLEVEQIDEMINMDKDGFNIIYQRREELGILNLQDWQETPIRFKEGNKNYREKKTGVDLNDLTTDIDRAVKSISTIQSVLQPFLLPIQSSDWKIALEGKGSWDTISPNDNPIDLSLAEPDQVIEQTQPVIKLQWNGAANTLYDIFRQLKNHHLPKGETLIDDSYDQIAQFIQNSFIGFDKLSISTIRGQLTNSDRPKKSYNQINLDLSEPD